MMRKYFARSCVLAAALVLSAGALAAQGRTITGTVVEEGLHTPLAAAQVQVKGTTIGALSRNDGTFIIRGAPMRDVVLTVRRIGFPPANVTVPATTNTVEIVLKVSVLNLDQVVVTGQATGISRRNLANDVASVSGTEVSKVSAQ